MHDQHSDPLELLAARQLDLETRYTHLQRTVDELNEVMIDQGRKIDSLERKLALLARQLGTLAEREVEPRSLEDDKPPHY